MPRPSTRTAQRTPRPIRAVERVRVRRMRLADVPAVGRIERAVFGGEAWPSSAFAYALDAFARSRPARGQLWVAVVPGRRVIGYSGIELAALGGEADVINLAVHPAYRRRGGGRRLLAAAAAYCRARRVPLLWLRVRASNRGARAFYRRCGFRVAGRFRDYYDDPLEDAVLMRLPSPPVRSGAPETLPWIPPGGRQARSVRRRANGPERAPAEPGGRPGAPPEGGAAPLRED